MQHICFKTNIQDYYHNYQDALYPYNVHVCIAYIHYGDLPSIVHTQRLTRLLPHEMAKSQGSLVASHVGFGGVRIPCQAKSMTYKIDTCHYLAWHFVLVGLGKDWFAEYWDNVIEWSMKRNDMS